MESDEFEKARGTIWLALRQEEPVTIIGADGTSRVEKSDPKGPITKRFIRPKKQKTRRYQNRDVAGDRATAIENRRRRIWAMPMLWSGSRGAPDHLRRGDAAAQRSRVPGSERLLSPPGRALSFRELRAAGWGDSPPSSRPTCIPSVPSCNGCEPEH